MKALAYIKGDCLNDPELLKETMITVGNKIVSENKNQDKFNNDKTYRIDLKIEPRN